MLIKFPNLVKMIRRQFQKAKWTANRTNTKKTSKRHVTITFLETERKIKLFESIKQSEKEKKKKKDTLWSGNRDNSWLHQKQCKPEDKEWHFQNTAREKWNQLIMSIKKSRSAKSPSKMKTKQGYSHPNKGWIGSPDLRRNVKACPKGDRYYLETQIYMVEWRTPEMGNLSKIKDFFFHFLISPKYRWNE